VDIIYVAYVGIWGRVLSYVSVLSRIEGWTKHSFGISFIFVILLLQTVFCLKKAALALFMRFLIDVNIGPLHLCLWCLKTDTTENWIFFGLMQVKLILNVVHTGIDTLNSQHLNYVGNIEWNSNNNWVHDRNTDLLRPYWIYANYNMSNHGICF